MIQMSGRPEELVGKTRRAGLKVIMVNDYRISGHEVTRSALSFTTCGELFLIKTLRREDEEMAEGHLNGQK